MRMKNIIQMKKIIRIESIPMKTMRIKSIQMR